MTAQTTNPGLPVWRTVGTAVVLGARAVQTFPLTVLFVVAVLAALYSYDFPDSWHALPAFAVWGSFLKMLAETAVYAPLAIMIHRFIILGELSEPYWATSSHARTVRFFAALFLLNLVGYLPSVLPFDPDWVTEIGVAMYVFWTASAVLWTRLCLAFPIIATDAATQPFRQSFRCTRGSSWAIFFVFFVIGAFDWALSMLSYYKLRHLLIVKTTAGSLAFTAAWALVDTLFFVVYVAMASHLWRTRGVWSGRGDVVAARAATPAAS
jgi:hypothetical protein